MLYPILLQKMLDRNTLQLSMYVLHSVKVSILVHERLGITRVLHGHHTSITGVDCTDITRRITNCRGLLQKLTLWFLLDHHVVAEFLKNFLRNWKWDSLTGADMKEAQSGTKTCKRCKTSFATESNSSSACRFHPTYFVSRRHDDQKRYYELGPDDPPYAAKFWDCCGSEDPEAEGCRTSFHVSYDEG